MTPLHKAIALFMLLYLIKYQTILLKWNSFYGQDRKIPPLAHKAVVQLSGDAVSYPLRQENIKITYFHY